MKKTIGFFTVCAAALGLAIFCGCSTPWGAAKRNIENSRNLRVGMTKNEVLEIMGEPIRDEKFCKPDLWFYYIEMVWGDGLITPEECMPLVFEDGKLIGWGNDFYLDHQIKRRQEDPGADLAKAESKKLAAEAEAKKAAEAASGKPAEAEDKKAAEAASGKPAETEAKKPAEAASGKPAETEAKKPAEAASGKPAEDKKPAETGKPENNAEASDPGKK